MESGSSDERVTYPNLESLPVFFTSPSMTPTESCTFPSASHSLPWRYMKPPHSAKQGMPPDTFLLIASRMGLLEHSFSAWSSGYPPDRTRASTSGSSVSFSGENSTISAPILLMSSMLSSYVKQKASSCASPILTGESSLLTSGSLYSRSGAADAISSRRSISRDPSRTSAS